MVLEGFDMANGVRCGNGTIYEQTVHGCSSQVYIPDSCSSSTNVSIYFPGAGGLGLYRDDVDGDGFTDGDGGHFLQYLENNSPDEVIIMSTTCSDTANNFENVNQALNTVTNEYNITSSDINYYGFSAGTKSALKFAKEYMGSHEDIGNQQIFLIDNCANQNYVKGDEENYLNLLKSNDAVIYSVGYDLAGDDSGLALLGRNGVNYVVVETTTNGHKARNDAAISNGMIDLLRGNLDSFGQENEYTFYKYNNETGMMEYKSLGEIMDMYAVTSPLERIEKRYATLNNLEIPSLESILTKLGYNPNTTITNDVQLVYNNMMKIKSIVKSSVFDSAFTTEQYSSTTKIPNMCSSMLMDYYQVTSQLLLKMANETEAIVSIALGLDKIDQNLLNEVLNMSTVDTNQENIPSTNGIITRPSYNAGFSKPITPSTPITSTDSNTKVEEKPTPDKSDTTQTIEPAEKPNQNNYTQNKPSTNQGNQGEEKPTTDIDKNDTTQNTKPEEKPSVTTPNTPEETPNDITSQPRRSNSTLKTIGIAGLTGAAIGGTAYGVHRKIQKQRQQEEEDFSSEEDDTVSGGNDNSYGGEE